jgi:hypothetical protein
MDDIAAHALILAGQKWPLAATYPAKCSGAIKGRAVLETEDLGEHRLFSRSGILRRVSMSAGKWCYDWPPRKYRKVDADTGDELIPLTSSRAEVGKGDYIEFSPEELEAVATATNPECTIVLIGGKANYSELAGGGSYLRESKDRPSENAFCLVAPAVLFRDFAILLAGVFFFARLFKSRTSPAVHSRFFAFLTITIPPSSD